MSDVQTKGNETLQNFLLFPDLPAEIRVQIWHIILDTHREITLKYVEEPRPSENEAEKYIRHIGYFTVEKDDNPSVLLGVNQEAREEALAFYDGKIDSVTCVGHSSWIHPELAQNKPTTIIRGEGKSIPLSFANTTFFLSTRELPRLPSSLLTQLQHLKFTVLDPAYFCFFVMDTLKSMTSLRTLTLAGKQIMEYSSWRKGQFYTELIRDFEDEKLRDLEWECPRVIIINMDTGEKCAEIPAAKGDPERLVVERVVEEDGPGESDDWQINL